MGAVVVGYCVMLYDDYYRYCAMLSVRCYLCDAILCDYYIYILHMAIIEGKDKDKRL